MTDDLVGKQTLEVMSKASHYNDWLYSIFKPYIRDNIVDISAGKGTFTKKLVDDFSNVSVTDVEPEYLSNLEKRFPSVLGYFLNLESGKVDSKLKNRFDCAIALNVIEHLSDTSQGLQIISQMLTPHGVAIILVPAFQFVYNNLDRNLGHYRRYTIPSLSKSVQAAGFKIGHIRYLNFWGLWGWFLTGKLLPTRQIPAWEVKVFDLVFRPWLVLERILRMPMGLSVLCIAQKV